MGKKIAVKKTKKKTVSTTQTTEKKQPVTSKVVKKISGASKNQPTTLKIAPNTTTAIKNKQHVVKKETLAAPKTDKETLQQKKGKVTTTKTAPAKKIIQTTKKYTTRFKVLVTAVAVLGLSFFLFQKTPLQKAESACHSVMTDTIKKSFKSEGFFKVFQLCSGLKIENSDVNIYLGKIKNKKHPEKVLNYSCFLVDKHIVVDFENAESFFYVDNIKETLEKETLDSLCASIKQLFASQVVSPVSVQAEKCK